MNQINRLKKGGRLNRTKLIRFWFNEKGYQGYPGDTLASALLANNVSLIGRSFKYHRPRGIFSAGSEEPNALVQLEKGAYTEPNRRATEIELYDGLIAYSQNCWPSVRFDLGAINSKISRLLPVGFYYKTFMWPRSLWMTYEKYIRKAAGLGLSPKEIDPDSYDKTHKHCDVLVIGGGPAGIQAAYVAGKAGAQVTLADEKNELGGSLLSENRKIGDQSIDHWLSSKIAELKRLDNIHILTRTTVTGYYDYNFLIANERCTEHLGPNCADRRPKERLWKIRAKQVVLATGAIERPMVFADNDRPGVMLAGAIRTYINRFGVLPGKNIAILTNNDSAYHLALDAKLAGADIYIIDIREEPRGELIYQVQEVGIEIIKGSVISSVGYMRGQIRNIEIMRLSQDGSSVTGKKKSLTTDLIGVSGGWTPTVHLYSQAKGKLKFLDDEQCFVPDYEGQKELNRNNPSFSAGACNTAVIGLKECLSQGQAAGIAAASAAGFTLSSSIKEIECDDIVYGTMRPLWVLPCDHPIGKGKKKHFHELHNDSTIADIELAIREGFESIEHLKRYTTTGMGTDQGKISNVNTISVMSDLMNTSIQAVGTTTFRPPYTPLSFGSIVGHDRRELFLQKRKTPIHSWHDRNGAVFEDVGDWKRPLYFPKVGEVMHTAVQRECLATRTSVGILDASTLGKIDLQGRDCKQLLNMLYTNSWNQLAQGRCRYGLMLNEHGMVFDDGVTTCLAENHYHMTTTTGGAARVMSWIEEWLQTEWPEMEAYATSVTEQWAVASLNGPNCHKVLEKLTCSSLDLESFPMMSMKEMIIANLSARVFRISFTGEPAFEINVPARYGMAMWQALMEAGEEFDICPYGTEAMHVLRAEKGFIIVGQDTDGTVTPIDLGMDWIVSKQKKDFLGRRSLMRTDTAREGRKQLVGVLTEDPNCVLQEGSHLVKTIKDAPPMDILGHITSSYMSPNVGRSIAMALVKDGFKRKGQLFYVPLMNGGIQKVTLTSPIFLNKDGGEHACD